MGIGIRRCVATKTVQTATGTARRCARYEETGVDVEHRGSFGQFARIMDWGVNVSDVAVGALAGFGGTAALKFLVNKVLPVTVTSKIPPFAMKLVPAVGGAAAGALLFAFGKGSSAAKGRAAGALTAGLTVTVWDLLRGQFPALAEAWTYNLPFSGGYGLLQPEMAAGGMPGQYGAYAALISDPRPGMAQLAAMHAEDDAP